MLRTGQKTSFVFFDLENYTLRIPNFISKHIKQVSGRLGFSHLVKEHN